MSAGDWNRKIPGMSAPWRVECLGGEYGWSEPPLARAFLLSVCDGQPRGKVCYKPFAVNSCLRVQKKFISFYIVVARMCVRTIRFDSEPRT